MNSFRVLTPANAIHLGHRIVTALRSVPLPHLDTRLAAEALRHAGSRIASARTHVAQTITPACLADLPDNLPAPVGRLETFRAFAQLGMEPSSPEGMPTALQIPSEAELIGNLKASGVDHLETLGESLEELSQRCQALYQQLDGLEDEAALTPALDHKLQNKVGAVLHLAENIRKLSLAHPGGFSAQLVAKMDRLIELGSRVEIDALAPEPSKIEPEEAATDFSRLNALVGSCDEGMVRALAQDVVPALNRLDEYRPRVQKSTPGSPKWCLSLVVMNTSLRDIGKHLEKHCKAYTKAGGDNQDLIDYLEGKRAAVDRERHEWIDLAEPHMQKFLALGCNPGDLTRPRDR